MGNPKKKVLNKSILSDKARALFCAVGALALCGCTEVPEHCGDKFPALNPEAEFCSKQDNRPYSKCGGQTYNTDTHECGGSGSIQPKGGNNTGGGDNTVGGNETTYAVTVTSTGAGASGTGSYTAGATVTISAGTPPDGQQFKNWTTSAGVTLADSNNATTTFTMPTNAVTVTAVFEANNESNFSDTTVSGSPFEMVFVPGGTFMMGCASEWWCDDNEKPEHSVKLSSYHIGKYEVTQGLWRAVMGSLPSSLISSSYGVSDNHPVYYVSWLDVQDFIGELNKKTHGRKYRLPTEAEWEFAARWGQSGGTMYSGSDNVEDVAWYGGNSIYGTKPVGGKDPNSLGIHDMSGNVWEWVYDWYGNYDDSHQNNPKGPEYGSTRIGRGGSWYYDSWGCRVSIRLINRPYDSFNDIGFRLALSP